MLKRILRVLCGATATLGVVSVLLPVSDRAEAQGNRANFGRAAFYNGSYRAPGFLPAPIPQPLRPSDLVIPRAWGSSAANKVSKEALAAVAVSRAASAVLAARAVASPAALAGSGVVLGVLGVLVAGSAAQAGSVAQAGSAAQVVSRVASAVLAAQAVSVANSRRRPFLETLT